MEYDPIARGTPMLYLFGKGTVAREIAPLLQGLLALAMIVVIVTSALALIGAWRRRSPVPLLATPLTSGERGGLRWIAVGVGLSSVALIGFVVWSTMTLAAISHAPSDPAFTVKVTAQRWWWAATYQNPDVSQSFTTANEIHIPVGQTVRFELSSPDVIHSFWVPSLAGKIDVIPGQTNVAWLRAERPGIYRGQCTNYCGEQHSHMNFAIVADPPETFEAWRKAQIQPAAGAPRRAGARGRERVPGALRDLPHRARRARRRRGRPGPHASYVAQDARGWRHSQQCRLALRLDRPSLSTSSQARRCPTCRSPAADLDSVRAYLLTLK